tara:strand:+ start:1191 stop:1511 length:321 start_codon:yes stop_codon:yes gene_type:complete
MLKYFFSILLFFLFSCSSSNTGAIQKAEFSYIKFLGDFKNVSVVIDDGEAINLSYYQNNMFIIEEKNTLFKTTKGKHSVKVYRGEALIVNRIIFIEDQATFEVLIP